MSRNPALPKKTVLALCPLFIGALILACMSFAAQNRTDILTPEEREWLVEHNGNIIINRGSENWAPIEGIDKNGNPFGIAIDYYKLIEKNWDAGSRSIRPAHGQKGLKDTKQKKSTWRTTCGRILNDMNICYSQSLSLKFTMSSSQEKRPKNS